MKKWEAVYGENIIRVENSFEGEKLFVNDTLQDEQVGYSVRARLWGKLQTGEEVKVSLGGWFEVNCRIFVDNQLMEIKEVNKNG